MSPNDEQGRALCSEAATLRKEWEVEGNLKKAEGLFRDAVQRFPDLWLAHYGLGELLLLNAARAHQKSGGPFDEGVAEMKQAVTLMPGQNVSLVKLAATLVSIDFDEARGFYQKIAEASKDQAECLYPVRWQSEDHWQFAIQAAEHGAKQPAVDAFCQAINLNNDYAGRYMPEPRAANLLWQDALVKLGKTEWFEKRKRDDEWILSRLTSEPLPSTSASFERLLRATQPVPPKSSWTAKKIGCLAVFVGILFLIGWWVYGLLTSPGVPAVPVAK